MIRNEVDILLNKYLQGKILPDEMERLQKLTNLSDDKDLTEYFQKQWDTYKLPSEVKIPELDIISGQLHQDIYTSGKAPVIHLLMRIAVAILILVTTGLSAYLWVDKRKMEVIGEREIVMQVEKGQRVGITLPDGSTIQLNSESVLSYRQNFGKQNRQVRLAGEGYFEVVKDPGKKFIVSTQSVDVEVLGTSFNLFAYEKENRVELTLVEGSVFLSTNTIPVQTAILEPNSKAIFEKNSGTLTIEHTNTELETAWRVHELVFRSEPLAEVIRMVEKRYGVFIHLDNPQLSGERYTGVFDKEELSDVLKILSAHFKFNYKIENGLVTIR